MAYSPQTWSDNNVSFPLSAARMNHLEAGIAAAVRRNEQRINVTYFQTGSLTDTQMINAAETFRAALNSGAELYFPAGAGSDTDGAYLLDPAHATAVFITSIRAGLVGDGRGRSIIRMKNTAGDYGAFFKFTGGDASYFSVHDLTFDGNSAHNAVAGTLPTTQKRLVIQVNSGTGLDVHGCEFINCNGTWTVFGSDGLTDVSYTGNLFTNIGANSTAIDTSTVYAGAQRMTVAHNTFLGGGLGAKTAIELHGDAQNCHHNTVADYYALGNLVGDRASAIGHHWHHNKAYRMGTGITMWPVTNAANTTAWSIEHATVEHNYIEIDWDAWHAAYPSQHRYGIGIVDSSTPLGMRDVKVVDNSIKYLPFTGTPTSTDGLSCGILFSRGTAYAGADDQITVSGNLIVNPMGQGIRFTLNNTVTTRLQITGDNVIIDSGSGDPGNTIFSSQNFSAGIFLGGAFTDCTVNRPKIIDDRGTHVIPTGVYLGGVTTAVNCELTDVNMRIADGVAVPTFLGATATAAAFYVKFRTNNYVAPAKPTLVGSQIVDQNGVTRFQTGSPTGTTWTALTIP